MPNQRFSQPGCAGGLTSALVVENRLVMNQQAHNGVSPDDMVTVRMAGNYAQALTVGLVATALSLLHHR